MAAGWGLLASGRCGCAALLVLADDFGGAAVVQQQCATGLRCGDRDTAELRTVCRHADTNGSPG